MQHSARFRLGWKNGLITAGILVLATALGLLFDWLDLQEVNLYALFLLGILLTAALTASRFCSAVSALAGILLFELLRAQPRFSLAFLRTLHPMDFLIPLGVALLMGSIAHNSRRLTDRTRLLLRADQLFLKANGREEILSITAQQLEQLLPRSGPSATAKTPARARRALPARTSSTSASARRRTSGACSGSSRASGR